MVDWMIGILKWSVVFAKVVFTSAKFLFWNDWLTGLIG
jgi:hypothetical protein